jgi:hypothetical protein
MQPAQLGNAEFARDQVGEEALLDRQRRFGNSLLNRTSGLSASSASTATTVPNRSSSQVTNPASIRISRQNAGLPPLQSSARANTDLFNEEINAAPAPTEQIGENIEGPHAGVYSEAYPKSLNGLTKRTARIFANGVTGFEDTDFLDDQDYSNGGDRYDTTRTNVKRGDQSVDILDDREAARLAKMSKNFTWEDIGKSKQSAREQVSLLSAPKSVNAILGNNYAKGEFDEALMRSSLSEFMEAFMTGDTLISNTPDLIGFDTSLVTDRNKIKDDGIAWKYFYEREANLIRAARPSADLGDFQSRIMQDILGRPMEYFSYIRLIGINGPSINDAKRKTIFNPEPCAIVPTDFFAQEYLVRGLSLQGMEFVDLQDMNEALVNVFISNHKAFEGVEWTDAVFAIAIGTTYRTFVCDLALATLNKSPPNKSPLTSAEAKLLTTTGDRQKANAAISSSSEKSTKISSFRHRYLMNPEDLKSEPTKPARTESKKSVEDEQTKEERMHLALTKAYSENMYVVTVPWKKIDEFEPSETGIESGKIRELFGSWLLNGKAWRLDPLAKAKVSFSKARIALSTVTKVGQPPVFLPLKARQDFENKINIPLTRSFRPNKNTDYSYVSLAEAPNRGASSSGSLNTGPIRGLSFVKP